MVVIESLNIVFENKKIISDFSLRIDEGEKVVLFGRSGTGKTQILNSMLGLTVPQSGKITVCGKIMSPENLDYARRNASWIPQDYNSIGFGTAKETIAKIFSLKANTALAPTCDVLDEEFRKLGLSPDIGEQQFDKLSGGEKQRISIMIAKLLRRPLIVADEPTSALDDESTRLVIKYLIEDLPGLTVVSASHDDRWKSACSRKIEIL